VGQVGAGCAVADRAEPPGGGGAALGRRGVTKPGQATAAVVRSGSARRSVAPSRARRRPTRPCGGRSRTGCPLVLAEWAGCRRWVQPTCRSPLGALLGGQVRQARGSGAPFMLHLRAGEIAVAASVDGCRRDGFGRFGRRRRGQGGQQDGRDPDPCPARLRRRRARAQKRKALLHLRAAACRAASCSPLRSAMWWRRSPPDMLARGARAKT
jgi:hypothetical protein